MYADSPEISLRKGGRTVEARISHADWAYVQERKAEGLSFGLLLRQAIKAHRGGSPSLEEIRRKKVEAEVMAAALRGAEAAAEYGLSKAQLESESALKQAEAIAAIRGKLWADEDWTKVSYRVKVNRASALVRADPILRRMGVDEVLTQVGAPA